MKVAAVEWKPGELDGITLAGQLVDRISVRMESAASEGVNLIVFPGYTGCLYELLKYSQSGLKELAADACRGDYLKDMCKLSLELGIAVCPGTYWNKEGAETFGASCVIVRGETILEQKQLYLARWERELGLGRGKQLDVLEFEGWKLAIIQSADVFYPQVSRLAALMGADIILSPTGFTGEMNKALQLSGMWQEVQQNLFFCIESAYNGRLADCILWGESVIHAPLEMTLEKDGLLVGSNGQAGYVSAGLDNDARMAAISRFDVLSQLNPEFYSRMDMFGGSK